MLTYYTKEGKFECNERDCVPFDKLHRIEWPSGSKHWYINGKLHRTDGPAFEGTKGTKSWYLHNISLTEEEYKCIMTSDNEYFAWQLATL